MKQGNLISNFTHKNINLGSKQFTPLFLIHIKWCFVGEMLHKNVFGSECFNPPENLHKNKTL